MTDKEIVQVLRCCRLANPCTSCPAAGRGKEVCFDEVHAAAEAAIERLTAENAALREKQAEAEAERDALIEQIKERHDCLDCKHNDFCKFDGAIFFDCMNCVTKNCPCAGCCDSSRWEWRGLPEAPEG